MSKQDITSGNKVAKMIAARMMKSKTGTPGIEIMFSFIEPRTSAPETLEWVAWLTPKAAENSVKTLVEVLGYNGDKKTDPQGIFQDRVAFDYLREVSIVVEHEEYNGNFYPKIKWVNSMGGSQFAGVTPEQIKGSLNDVGFDALVLAAKQGLGTPKKKTVETDVQIPF